MEHQLNFTITRDLVTTATRRFWLQFIGRAGLLRWAAVSVALILLSGISLYRFTDLGLGTTSDLGSAEIPWRMLEKVQRHPDVWLLFFGRRNYAYFPTAELSRPLEEYILQQAEKHGIKAT